MNSFSQMIISRELAGERIGRRIRGVAVNQLIGGTED